MEVLLSTSVMVIAIFCSRCVLRVRVPVGRTACGPAWLPRRCVLSVLAVAHIEDISVGDLGALDLLVAVLPSTSVVVIAIFCSCCVHPPMGAALHGQCGAKSFSTISGPSRRIQSARAHGKAIQGSLLVLCGPSFGLGNGRAPAYHGVGQILEVGVGYGLPLLQQRSEQVHLGRGSR